MKSSTTIGCIALSITAALVATSLPLAIGAAPQPGAAAAPANPIPAAPARGGRGAGRGGGRGNATGQGNDAFYQLGPDSMVNPNVPHGKLIGPLTLDTKIYSGPVPATTGQGGANSLTALSAASPTPMAYCHGYWIYVPAQYDATKPAALIVFNDGQPMKAENGDVRAINVIDNLTWRREMPVAITIFLDPGRPAGTPEPNLASDWGDNTTLRPWEYQWLDGKYAKVVCDEILPAVAKDYNITPDPNMHAIMGASSGGIAAFTVAWDRPDTFRKVISIVGSFTHIRGGEGNSYPEKVAVSDKKPLRVFFQDGVNDNRRADAAGDWHTQNVRLIDALTAKGYDINYSFGIGLHGQKQGGAILPEMMRWLWHDYPRDSDQANQTERAFNGPASQPAAASAPAQ